MSGSPKYLNKKQPKDIPSKPLCQNRLMGFLKTRRGSGKVKNSVAILGFLRENQNNYDEEGVPFAVILKHMSTGYNMSRPRLAKLLNDMVDWQIVDKIKDKDISSNANGNQYRSFYQLNPLLSEDQLTIEGYKKENGQLKVDLLIQKMLSSNTRTFTEEFLRKHNISLQEWDADYGKWKKAKREERRQSSIKVLKSFSDFISKMDEDSK
jgi:hypothetical protein